MEALLALAALRSVGDVLASLAAPAPAPVIMAPKADPPRGPFFGATGQTGQTGGFDAMLRSQGAAGDPKAVSFAEEVKQQLAQRGVHLSAAQMDRLLAAVDQAAARGGQKGLILMDDFAYTVDLRTRTVTGMTDRNRLDAQAFAQADSVVEAKS